MNIEHVKIFVQGNTKVPTRAKGDAGIDLYMPNLTESFIKDLTDKNPGQPFRWSLIGAPKDEEEVKNNKGVYLQLSPHEDIVIPTYVSARIPENCVLIMTNKSGVATGQKLKVGADTIDSSYQGIIHIHVFNFSNVPRFIEFGQKLAQMVPQVFNNEDIEIFYDDKIETFKEYKNFVSKEKFYEGHSSERGDKGFSEGTGKF